MNMRTIGLLAVVGAVATGAFGTDVIFAQTQTQPKRPAFYISEFELSDPEGIKPYSQQVEATFAPFTGRYVVRGGQTASLEGDQPKRIVMIAFDSMAQAQAGMTCRPIVRSDRSAFNRQDPVSTIVEGAPEVR